MVVQQVADVCFERRLLVVYRLYAFFRPRETAEEEQHARRGYDGCGHEPARLLRLHAVAVTAECVCHGHEQQQGNKASDVCEHHAERRKGVPFVWIWAHNAEQRGVRHVDGGVHHHHQRIRNVGVNELACVAERRRIERKSAHNAERNGQKEYVGTELSPPAACPVGHDSYYRVEHGVPYSRNEEHRSHHGGRQTEHVGVEYHQVRAKQFPEHRRRHVAEAVTNPFPKPYHKLNE